MAAIPYRKIADNSLCPCESGRIFSHCCKGRKLRWERTSDGLFELSKRLNKDALEIIEEERQHWIEVFAREPLKGDRMLLSTYQLSENSYRRNMLKAMRRADIPSQLVYAYQKTGIITTEFKRMTGKDEDDYREAIHEYFDIVATNPDFEPDEEGVIEDKIAEQLEKMSSSEHTLLITTSITTRIERAPLEILSLLPPLCSLILCADLTQ